MILAIGLLNALTGLLQRSKTYVNHRCSLESKSKRDSSMPRVSPALVIATQDSEPRSDIDLQDAGGC